MSLKENIKFYVSAIPKVAEAYGKKLIGDVANTEEQKHRKAKCESCILFTGSNCNKNILASYSGKYVNFSDVEKDNNIIKFKDSSNIIRHVVIDNERYFRGCGCPLVGASAKWKLSFSKRELNKKDGTGPCPMGKW